MGDLKVLYTIKLFSCNQCHDVLHNILPMLFPWEFLPRFNLLTVRLFLEWVFADWLDWIIVENCIGNVCLLSFVIYLVQNTTSSLSILLNTIIVEMYFCSSKDKCKLEIKIFPLAFKKLNPSFSGCCTPLLPRLTRQGFQMTKLWFWSREQNCPVFPILIQKVWNSFAWVWRSKI